MELNRQNRAYRILASSAFNGDKRHGGDIVGPFLVEKAALSMVSRELFEPERRERARIDNELAKFGVLREDYVRVDIFHVESEVLQYPLFDMHHSTSTPKRKEFIIEHDGKFSKEKLVEIYGNGKMRSYNLQIREIEFEKRIRSNLFIYIPKRDYLIYLPHLGYNSFLTEPLKKYLNSGTQLCHFLKKFI